MILTGKEIEKRNIITPFHSRTELIAYGKKYSYGCSFVGYDVRMEFDKDGTTEFQYLEPSRFLLVSTVEQFDMPEDVVGIVHDKSSWARRGLAVQNTVLEPGWKGHLTLELSNHGPQTLYLSRGWPIAQVIFHLTFGDKVPYHGKYQNQQRGPQEAR